MFCVSVVGAVVVVVVVECEVVEVRLKWCVYEYLVGRGNLLVWRWVSTDFDISEPTAAGAEGLICN